MSPKRSKIASKKLRYVHTFLRRFFSICIDCKNIQEWRSDCVDCGRVFGDYVCRVCKIINIDNVDMFHCDECGRCYYGDADDFKHCSECGKCIDMKIFDDHRCIEVSLNDNCVVCMDELDNGVPIRTIRCGHILHQKCYEDLLPEHKTCPICCKEIVRDIDVYSIKDEDVSNEISHKKVDIFCKECESDSHIDFYYSGLKCPICHSYNTFIK
jgi:RING finger/CHY zinc finger protein 1